ncbi:MAG: hypothetical protein ACRCYU_10985 [Nocardioides sp.]
MLLVTVLLTAACVGSTDVTPSDPDGNSSVSRPSSVLTTPQAVESEAPRDDPYENDAVALLREKLATIGLTDLGIQEGEFQAANLGGALGNAWLNARLRPKGRFSDRGRIESDGSLGGIAFEQILFGGSRFLRFECGSAQLEVSVTPTQLSAQFKAEPSRRVVERLGQSGACG